MSEQNHTLRIVRFADDRPELELLDYSVGFPTPHAIELANEQEAILIPLVDVMDVYSVTLDEQEYAEILWEQENGEDFNDYPV